MKYSNPLPEEGINTSQSHPLKELITLSLGLIVLVALGVFLLGIMANTLARHIPFEVESNIASSMPLQLESRKNNDTQRAIEQYLQTLANKLASAQQLPQDMRITVHYVDSDTVNAMATLGGHIIMFRGLLQKLKSENALAMVLGHEIAHIHLRHPIQTLGRGAVISLALSAIGITTGDMGHILGSTGLLTALNFSRDQEQQADEMALQSLEQHYGHVHGATDLFQVLLHEAPKSAPNITFLSTHPLTQHRIEHVLDYAKQHHWQTQGVLTPIPHHIAQALHPDKAAQKQAEPTHFLP